VEAGSLTRGEGSGEFRLERDVDISNAEPIRRHLQDALSQSHELTLDVAGVTFMDSQGLQMLLRLGKQAVEERKIVRLVNVPDQVRRLLDIAVPEGIPGVEASDPGKT